MKCFQCKFPDCRYSGKMTKWEKEQYRIAHIKTYDMPKEDREKLYAERRNAKRRKAMDET